MRMRRKKRWMERGDDALKVVVIPVKETAASAEEQ